ncbi:uncharacterized protein EV422DRAFT_515064 [Fimicolochytrium jonesii]|uniref:uncharacterized protein n=1 Tax=Fimicolochytrium jonesii TaxID=1396493 RepID=UPI0022FE90A1|nr:uncharacterized protein EV422DRAFT_515064 [Fimicolochytrium jonesii]KAI8826033.1 hypothetical protein EV422DRAFT_515064 [Fimicolochytrium jonesii]
MKTQAVKGLTALWLIKQVAAQANATTACLYLDADSICGPAFVGYPVPKTSGIDSVAALNAAILGYTGDGLAKKISTAPQNFACSGDLNLLNGAVQHNRYQISVWCSGLVAQTLLSGKCKPTAAAPTGIDPTVLCAERCNKAFMTMNGVFTNTSVCQTVLPVNLKERRDDLLGGLFTAFTSSIPNYCTFASSKDQSTCFKGVPRETSNNCGYFSAALAQQECQANTGDACCKNLLDALATGASFIDSDKSVNAKKVSVLSPIGIAAIALGVLLFIAVIGFGCCIYKRRQHRRRRLDRQSASNAGVEDGFQTETVPPVPPLPRIETNMDNVSSRGRAQWSPNVTGPPMAYNSDYSGPAAPPGFLTQMQQTQAVPAFPGHTRKSPIDRIGGAPRAAWEEPVVTPQMTVPFVKAPSSSSSPQPSPADPAEMNLSHEEPMEFLNVPVTVVHPYVPALSDELPLHAGSTIMMLKNFDDGWGLGTNAATGETGAFPLVCVQLPDEVASKIRTSALTPLPSHKLSVLMTVSKRDSSQLCLAKMDMNRLSSTKRSTTSSSGVGQRVSTAASKVAFPEPEASTDFQTADAGSSAENPETRPNSLRVIPPPRVFNPPPSERLSQQPPPTA